MKSLKLTGNRPHSETILYSILFLFFFQLISDFVEAIYAFGLMGTGIPVEIVCVLFLFSPVILLLLPRGISGRALVFLGEAMLVSRVVEVMLDTRGRMIVAGIGVGCFMLLFPALLWNQSRDDDEDKSNGLTLGIGLTVALSLSILFRALNSGTDISTYSWFQAIGWILAAIAGVLMLGLSKTGQALQSANRPSFLKTTGLSLGLTSVLVLLYFAFTSPNVIARWTGVSYLPVVSIILLALCLFAYLLPKRRLMAALTPRTVLIWNVLFVLALVATILVHQIKFPSDAGAYPLAEPPVTLLHRAPLVLMLILFPVVLVDFVLFARKMVAIRPSSRALGASFTVAALFFLLMIFAQVFTTVYDYIPVVGPFFRNKFWLVFLAAGAVLTLPVLLVGSWRETVSQRSQPPSRGRPMHETDALATGAPSILPGTILLISLATLAGAFLAASRPAAPPDQKTSLRILTYNIQQGYSETGLKNFNGQLDLIQGVDADIIGLQECDTNRIAGGNSDVVRYFANRLDMHSYYGPKTVPGTFGIALLSRYPIENPRTLYMYSAGEQTATIEAQITVGGKTFNVFVTHLGNGGPIVQQEQVLENLRGKANVILMGDFNFRPDTDQYGLTTETLDDSWLLKWSPDVGEREVDSAGRIDHIFVSPGTMVADSQYFPGPQSDHPAMMTEIEW